MLNPKKFRSNKIERRILFLIVLLGGRLFLSEAQAAASHTSGNPSDFSQNPDYGDAFVVGQIGDARTLVPILASDSPSSYIVNLVFNGLLKYNRDVELVGDLATRWDIEDDGLAIVFHLRDDVR